MQLSEPGLAFSMSTVLQPELWDFHPADVCAIRLAAEGYPSVIRLAVPVQVNGRGLDSRIAIISARTNALVRHLQQQNSQRFPDPGKSAAGHRNDPSSPSAAGTDPDAADDCEPRLGVHVLDGSAPNGGLTSTRCEQNSRGGARERAEDFLHYLG